jgi:hypothetical protein
LIVYVTNVVWPKTGPKSPNSRRDKSASLADESDPKAIKRLTAAREYLEGLSPARIHTKYG